MSLGVFELIIYDNNYTSIDHYGFLHDSTKTNILNITNFQQSLMQTSLENHELTQRNIFSKYIAC